MFYAALILFVTLWLSRGLYQNWKHIMLCERVLGLVAIVVLWLSCAQAIKTIYRSGIDRANQVQN